ncbi:MAG TPA: MaoC family dehydratase [Acidimicrobiales bacterium]|nr:MaoC family dehydratase [Acidimicrobiales bacterium]
MRTWLEEYSVGDEMRSPYFRLRTEEIVNYARYTHDLRPLLFDTPERAAEPMFIPPLYLLSLGMCLLSQSEERSYLPERLIAFLGFQTVTFGARAQVDDLIYSWAAVDAVDLGGRRGRLWYRHEVRNQDDAVLVANRHGMYVGRRADEA